MICACERKRESLKPTYPPWSETSPPAAYHSSFPHGLSSRPQFPWLPAISLFELYAVVYFTLGFQRENRQMPVPRPPLDLENSDSIRNPRVHCAAVLHEIRPFRPCLPSSPFPVLSSIFLPMLPRKISSLNHLYTSSKFRLYIWKTRFKIVWYP